MRLKNLKDVESFVDVVDQCQGEVYLTDWLSEENREHNVSLNLKSPLCLYLGISKLLSEHGDWFEIHCAKKCDEPLFFKFMYDLKNRSQGYSLLYINIIN